METGFSQFSLAFNVSLTKHKVIRQILLLLAKSVYILCACEYLTYRIASVQTNIFVIHAYMRWWWIRERQTSQRVINMCSRGNEFFYCLFCYVHISIYDCKTHIAIFGGNVDSEFLKVIVLWNLIILWARYKCCPNVMTLIKCRILFIPIPINLYLLGFCYVYRINIRAQSGQSDSVEQLNWGGVKAGHIFGKNKNGANFST